MTTDSTHEPGLRSWVESSHADATDFPIQNLPYGVFTRAGSDDPPQIGVAIGEHVLDVTGCVEARLLDPLGPEGCCALSASTLNPFLALGAGVWTKARAAISRLLAADTADLRDDAEKRGRLLVAQTDVAMHLPAAIGDYTDFYCSIHHATNVGKLFRPDNPLLPNYKHLPVGYHGRSSSLVPSGTPVRRPMGQTVRADADAPTFGASRLLDYELEMGFLVGPGNARGDRLTMADATSQIFGLMIVNDWSARDVQKWEYQPLGPFNAKNFCTSISPWVVTLEALAPYRIPGPSRPDDDPPVLDYLAPADAPREWMGLDIEVEASVASETMRADGTAPFTISRSNFRHMYWTIAQMLVHHSSTGCNMSPGDLLASGTVSGPGADEGGCLLERTNRGQNPLTLPDGTERRFLEDGDEVIIRAWCEKDGTARIGFGDCRGVVEPAG